MMIMMYIMTMIILIPITVMRLQILLLLKSYWMSISQNLNFQKLGKYELLNNCIKPILLHVNHYLG